jgi:hypothetical protein
MVKLKVLILLVSLTAIVGLMGFRKERGNRSWIM